MRTFWTVFLLLTAGTAGAAEAPAPRCDAPADLISIEQPLVRTAQRIALGEAATIVAIGSSSTAGAGATSAAASYPGRLETELRSRYPNLAIRVLNRGVNGEEAPQMLARFETDVAAVKPDLVLWQVGTNSVLRDRKLAGEAPVIRDGLRRLRATGADVVVIDPQYAPKVLAKPDHDDMVELIGIEARRHGAAVFHRFEVMRHWRESAGIPFQRFLSPDELHMNDWSYGCMAQLLAGAISDAANRSLQTAQAPAR